MAQGLNISRLNRVSYAITPASAQVRSFGILIGIGDSDVINGQERVRSYTGLSTIASQFGTSAPEYLGAQKYYAQRPQPFQMLIGRWIRTATAGFISGGILTATEQNIANWTSITTGSFTISADGNSEDVLGLDFSLQTNLNGVAAVINSALTGGTIAFNGTNFIFTSATAGTTSTVSYATTAPSGTDISAQLKLTAATALAPIDGYNAETPLQALQAILDVTSDFYGIAFAASTFPTDDDYIAMMQYVEALEIDFTLGGVVSDSRALSASFTTDLFSRAQALQIQKADLQYDDVDPYAIFSYYGRAFTTNFNAPNSLYTIMYKNEPGVIPQYLTTSQADVLKSKNGNVFVNYQVGNGNFAIIQYGTCPNGIYLDEKHGIAWFVDALKVAYFNRFYTTLNKVPQTEEGQNQLIAAATQVCQQAISNGLIAPGTWNSDDFPGLERGQILTLGFAIYSESINAQDQAAREQRICPPILIALKLKGALQETDTFLTINR